MKTITIATKEPGLPWEARTVPDKLETYQAIVGGYIEHFHTSNRGVDYFCNEEGKLKKMQPNVVVRGQQIVGPIFAVRSDEEGEFISLTEDDLECIVGKAGK